jgi:hypothetical protein
VCYSSVVVFGVVDVGWVVVFRGFSGFLLHF